jgi:hypothetical protein
MDRIRKVAVFSLQHIRGTPASRAPRMMPLNVQNRVSHDDNFKLVILPVLQQFRSEPRIRRLATLSARRGLICKLVALIDYALKNLSGLATSEPPF